MGIDHTAKHALALPQGMDQPGLANGNASHYVVVTTEIFGAAMNYQIDAVAQRPLVNGRGKGGVNHRFDTLVLLGNGRHFSKSATRK